MSARPRPVVVNADDFGLVAEINRAVERAHRAGNVTSATLMTNGEAVEDAAATAAANPGLGIGLHFVLTFGSPLAQDVRSLMDPEGRFVGRAELVKRILLGRIRADDVTRELEAQLARLDALGVQPTHLDGHQHVQVLPIVSAVVADVTRRRGLRVRIPTVTWDLSNGVQRLVRRLPLAVLCAHADRVGVAAATGAFVSIFDAGRPKVIRPEVYVELLRAARGPSVEIMVHPSLASRRLAEIHPALYETALAEAAVLSDPTLAHALTASGAHLTSFRDLPYPADQDETDSVADR